MRLHEEYTIRKGLDVPIILYEHESCVIMRTKAAPYLWNVFSINWCHGRYAPGHFEISISQPNCNSFSSDDFFRSQDFVVQWDEYADFVTNYVEEVKDRWIVIEEKERNLAMWSMFLQVYDGWLSKNTTSEFHSLVTESIREDNDFSKRLKAFKNARLAIETNDDIRRLLKYQVFPIARKHSNWLENLINDR